VMASQEQKVASQLELFSLQALQDLSSQYLFFILQKVLLWQLSFYCWLWARRYIPWQAYLLSLFWPSLLSSESLALLAFWAATRHRYLHLQFQAAQPFSSCDQVPSAQMISRSMAWTNSCWDLILWFALFSFPSICRQNWVYSYRRH